MAAYRISPVWPFKEFGRTIYKLRLGAAHRGSVLGLAYVMNLSGQTLTSATWIAAAPARSSRSCRPILGWLGTAVTGSDTRANALFATLQQSAARRPGSTRPCSSPRTPPVAWSAR